MKKYVKLTALLFAVSLIFAGCGGKPETNPNVAVTPESSVSDVQQGDTPVENAPEGAVQPENADGENAIVSPEEDGGLSPESSDKIETILNELDLKRKVYQLFIITPEALTGNPQVVAFGELSQECIQEKPVGGLVYFSPNLEDRDQALQMLHDTQDFTQARTKVGLFMAVDEEGGTVARVADNLNTTQMQSMQNYGKRNDAKEVREVGETIGNDIKQFYFNLDFAPVADVNLNSENELGDRIFSKNPQVVADLVSAYVKGLQSTGVAATLKHFPGLGAEDGNAHEDDKVIIDRTLDELREEEFVPFRSGIEAGADFVMVSHQIVTGIEDDPPVPSCLSHKVCTELLREELGFDGLIVTDSMQMNTISGSYSSEEAAVMAINAGVDVILMPEDFEKAVQGILDAVEAGEISERRIDESVRRILQEKEKMGVLPEFDENYTELYHSPEEPEEETEE
ncbi:MAG: glycoside hydrolase family 3 N-terminal domain-containing protein [Oscillospiraceae bacterium]